MSDLAVREIHIEPFNQAKRELLKRTICPKDLSNDEFDLFEAVCMRTGLDPFAKQIYAIKRGGKLCIDTSIDGFRLIAARSHEYGGQEGPFWCGEDGVWVDVWLNSEPPAAAKVGVWRTGFKAPVWGVALFKSFAPYFNNKLADMWTKMPEVMIAKCAESQALRKAFPAELSGVYTSDEMEQSDDVPNVILPDGRTVNRETGEVRNGHAPKNNSSPKQANGGTRIVNSTNTTCPECHAPAGKIHADRCGLAKGSAAPAAQPSSLTDEEKAAILDQERRAAEAGSLDIDVATTAASEQTRKAMER
jgi:phage recombination protein Bet